MEQQQQNQKRTAVQRIEDLERGVMGMFQSGDMMGRDLMTCKEAIKLLGNKIDAIVKAIQRGGELNDDVIGNIMVENNVTELKTRVDQLIAAGTLVATTEPVGDDNFVVGREVDDTGKVLNPRLQFVLGALQEELRNKIKGAKTGDTVEFQEGKVKFELQEAYSVAKPAPAVQAVPEAAPEASPAPAVEAAPAAPQAEQSSTDASNDSAPQSSPASES